MSSGRFVKSTVDWKKLIELCPKHQLNQLKEIKSKSTLLENKISNLPIDMPVIDWVKYEKVIPGIAEKFKKEYGSITIPYPKDTSNKLGNIKECKQKMINDTKPFVTSLEKIIASSTRMKTAMTLIPPMDDWINEIYQSYFPRADYNLFTNAVNSPQIKNVLFRSKIPPMHWDLN